MTEISTPETYMTTLYRLHDVTGAQSDLRELLQERAFQDGYEITDVDHNGLEGVLIVGTIHGGPPDWCPVIERLTGVPARAERQTSSALLLFRTGRATYAAAHGNGRFLIDPLRIDQDFGLAFATRSLDADDIRAVRRNIMDARGRVDETMVSRGEPLTDFGIERVGTIVTKISGTASGIPLTYVRHGKRRNVRVVCGEATIKLPLATSTADFLAEIAAIEGVCDRPEPLSELAAIDRVRHLPPSSEAVKELDNLLDEMLADPANPHLAVGVPVSHLSDIGPDPTYRVSRGTKGLTTGQLEVDHLLAFVSSREAGTRLRALHGTRVELFEDSDRTHPIGHTPAHLWLLAEVQRGATRYFHFQGRWYEIGAGYLQEIEAEFRELIGQPSSVTLKPWPRTLTGEDAEHAYNESVADQPGYTLFDKKMVHTKKFNGGGLEICDVLGPRNQLICVKQAQKGTEPLNHLVKQATVAVEALRVDRAVGEKFRDMLQQRAPWHPMIDDFRDLTVVFAILLKDGEPITVDSLFAFAQISLLQEVRSLRAHGVNVELVSITR